ncbi:nuclear receptor-interacting protein 3-like [Protopterus annectens]|uniref:nuclear receptor-interacting protein 3-like n=1 Tax=Protopterus annectens TaxID=7888 RepID=UPI001CF93676|nr:nuclear receptor-interacting protein 3-like [Protopterus annectens]
MSDSKKNELDIRDKAILHQQRRLKQATQFMHKDSADLLPLDGLKRLGTSKDLQPHSIVQRRLLEGNIGKLQADGKDSLSRTRSPLAEENEEEEDIDSRPNLRRLIVQCKCGDQEVKATINTGCQMNVMSRKCVERLSLQEVPLHEEEEEEEDSLFASPYHTKVVGKVKKLQIMLGHETVECSALVVEDEKMELSLGLGTLLFYKCCIDLEKGMLRLSTLELPFLDPSEEQGE